ncbi:glycosyltransferase family A protein [Pontibacter arcticus]|uniref:Glycosyltransferase 2-like domain-containing protein n=1 Tax=Pontibacter arcticus TaxID=2080288 RepID=A0A364RDT0_9BACT|nr:glycosyltransferase family A protein [Pontibacter arcticus]RAU82417.1 hypothetical protein DP923_11575 [Pontibacter arcticus]
MNTNHPGFTVIIPVHNKLPHLERSIHSVLNQTYADVELILVDDASTDGSTEKLATFNDPRVKKFRRDVPGPGGYAARNVGIHHATKEWICFLDADDEWELNLLETLAAEINKDQELETICWGWYLTTGQNKVLNPYSAQNKQVASRTITLVDFLIGPQQIWTGAVAFKKSLIIKAGGFPEQGFKRGGDMDTWTRCLWYSKKSIWLNKAMSYYYLDSVNMVTQHTGRNIDFIFSPFLESLLQKGDPEVKEAIHNYRNRYLYIMLNGQVYEGKGINYGVLKKMYLNKQAVWLTAKLHLNKLRLAVKA